MIAASKDLRIFYKRHVCNISSCRTEDLPFVSSFQGRSGELATCFLELRVRTDCSAPRGHILIEHTAFELISTQVLPVPADVNTIRCTNCDGQINITQS